MPLARESLTDTKAARSNLKERVVRGFTQTLFLSGVEFVARLAATAVLARLIAPGEFGIFMLVTAVTAVADQFRDLGLSTATIQREEITNQEVSNLFWINVAAGVTMAGAVCAVSPLAAWYFHEPRLTTLTMALASTFVLSGLSVQHEALLGRQLRVGPKAAMRLLAFVLSSLAGIALAAAGYSYWALAWREIVRSALIVGGAWFLCRWVPAWPSRETDVRHLVRFGSGLTATYILGAVAGSLDRFLLGRLEGAGSVGLYRQSYQLVVAPMSQLMGPLYQVSLPSLSMLQGQPEQFKRAFARIVSLVALISMPVAVLVAVCAHEIALVMLGSRWTGASIFIRIFAVGSLLQSVFSTAGFVLVSQGRSADLLRLTVTQLGLRVAFMAVGALWGAVGVAAADMLSTAVVFLPYLRWAFADSPVSTRCYLEAIARPLAGSAVLAVVLTALLSALPPLSPAVVLGVAAVTAGACFPIAIALMPGGRAELSGWLSSARAMLNRSGVA